MREDTTMAGASPWAIRAYAGEADLPRLVRLLTAVEAADQEGEDTSETAVRRQMQWLAADEAHDRLVVPDPQDSDRLIGFGGVWKALADERAYAMLAVHPAWRRRGIGVALFERLRARARAQGATALGVGVDTRKQEANAFAQRYGFICMSAYTQMRAPGGLPADPPRWPDGFTVRSVADGIALSTITEAMNSSYAGLWGHNIVTEAQVAEWLPEWTPAGCFLLFAPDGTVAGICRAEMSQELSARRGAPTGYIDGPGIVAEQRAADLYMPLLRTALRWLNSQGPTSIELESWGDAPETLALYATVGFAVMRQANQYRLDLS